MTLAEYLSDLAGYLPGFLRAAWIALEVTVCVILLSWVCGLLGALGKQSQWRVLRWPSEFYVWFIRGTPTLDLARRERFPALERAGALLALDDEEGITEDELLRARDVLARSVDARLTMHAAETPERMVLIRARLGRTTVELLHAHGLLGPRLLLSHAIHVTPAELDLLAATETPVVASPVAEMKLSGLVT